MNKKFHAEEGATGRLDRYLIEKLEESYSRNEIKKQIESGCITVNGNRVKPSYSVREGDHIVAELPEITPHALVPQNIPLHVVYEDESVIVINKRKNISVHPGSGIPDGTLVNSLLHHIPSIAGVGAVDRPGIVHRIDKDTSGLIVAAKNETSYESLVQQFSTHSVKREYYGIVWGRVFDDRRFSRGSRSGKIDTFFGRKGRNRIRFSSLVSKGKRAVTYWSIIEEFKNFSLLGFRLDTGRTHQIRVHCSDCHHPVVGDRLYGGNRTFSGNARIANAVDDLKGQLLHSIVIGFQHPEKNEWVEFTSDLPEDMKNFQLILREEDL